MPRVPSAGLRTRRNTRTSSSFVLDAGAASRGSGNAGTNKEKTVRQWFVDHAELKKNDYNISPSRYIHTSDAETYRPIAEIVEEFNKRQRAILELAVSTGSVTNRQVQEKFGVVRDATHRYLVILCELELLQQEGKGRATHYTPKNRGS